MGAGTTLEERHLAGEFAKDQYDKIEPDFDMKIDGFPVAWPIRKTGSPGRWGLGRETLLDLVDQGMARVGEYDDKRRTWAISYLSEKLRAQLASGFLEVVDRDSETGVIDARYVDVRDRRVKTVWHRSAHDGGAHGSDLVVELIGERRFDYPKSVYAVRDTLDALTADKPDALIVDFFAGTGTTLHSTMLLNSEDGGSRQCILVTNNEVAADLQDRLRGQGHLPGDPEWEEEGVFWSIALPRCLAALTGSRHDGTPLPRTYMSGREMKEGFDESIDFFELSYLEPDLVELGAAFAAIHSCLWLAAGAVGSSPERHDPDSGFLVRADSNYAVLFDENQFDEFVATVEAHGAVEYVWLVTDSEEIFSEMAQELPRRSKTSMLYRDYLRNFRINVEAAL